MTHPRRHDRPHEGAATAALTATQQQPPGEDRAQPSRDIADIIVCEPFTIRVRPAEKK